MKALSVLFSLTLALGAVGCGDSGDGGDGGDGGDHTAHWGYSGEEGPSHWGDLSTDWATCKTGTEQSPIDIPAGTHAGMADGLSMAYDESAVTILNNGHTVQVNYDAGSDLTYGGKTYELKQFHFHAHSENTVEGMSYPMEMHLVHAAADGSLAVVGVFIDEGAENAALADVFANMPADESEATAIAGAAVNATDLLPADKASWRFDGSLTTPPCSEGVKWILMEHPIEASAAQIEAFTDIDDHNYRPTQDLNGRTIEGDSHAGAPHWGYSGEEGPSHWGDLSTDWATCKDGTEQSPIDIPAGTDPGVSGDLAMGYSESAVTILNNGHTVQVNYDAGSDLTYGGVAYELKQFHFHAHSENTVEGMSYPMEMHLVHATAGGDLAVIGVFIEEGAENAALADVFANMPADESEATAIAGAAVNATDILPADKASWRFDGSLTTPPCSEGVKWILMATPIEASAAQIEAFTDIDDHNYRPTQDLNGRTIEGL